MDNTAPETWTDEGQALAGLQRHSGDKPHERFDVVVIGAGQAGLSVGYYLAQRGLRFVILDAHQRVGDSWRERWDSLRLFTPARFDGLVGMPFPAPPDHFPSKDEMADYLASYAARFALPVRSGVRVQRLSRPEPYIIETSAGTLEAAHVVIAMASYQERRVPNYASQLGSEIVQLHSSDYRNPGQLRDGAVLIVGAGNSGAEIAKELARDGRKVYLSGRDTGQVPFRMDGFWGRLFLARLVLRVIFHHVLTVRTPMGRAVRRKVLSQGGPLIRTKRAELAQLGVQHVQRVAGVKDGKPLLADGSAPEVANVVWSTGFEPGSSFIQLPVFAADGEPVHDRGVVRGEPGLYFVGLHLIHAMSSTMIHGVGRDAARIVDTIARRGHVFAKGARETVPQAPQRALEHA